MSKDHTPDQLRHIVRAAAGMCPIRFTMFWMAPTLPPESVIYAWYWEVRHYGLRRGEFYTAEAIANWASDQFPMTTDEFDHIYSSILAYAEAIGDHGLDKTA